MISRMKKKKMPDTQKDCLEDKHRTAVRMVEDKFRDTTEPHLKTVNTLEAEVRKVLSKEFATFGGKHEVQKGINFTNGKKQVVSLSAARNSMAVYNVEKKVKSVKSAMGEVKLSMPLNPKMSETDGSNFNAVQGAGLRKGASWEEDEVLKDADDPHLPTPVLEVY